GRQQPVLHDELDHARGRGITGRDPGYLRSAADIGLRCPGLHQLHDRDDGRHLLPLHAQSRPSIERRGELRRPDDRSPGPIGALPAGQSFVPATTTTPFCTTMQVPGPTLVVTEGQTVTVTLTNNLPASAGNTSILFPGFTLTSACPAANQGLLTCEAAPGGSVTYTFTASSPGTRAYYSGTQGDLQVEMGLYGAIIVLPASVQAVCTNGLPTTN